MPPLSSRSFVTAQLNCIGPDTITTIFNFNHWHDSGCDPLTSVTTTTPPGKLFKHTLWFVNDRLIIVRAVLITETPEKLLPGRRAPAGACWTAALLLSLPDTRAMIEKGRQAGPVRWFLPKSATYTYTVVNHMWHLSDADFHIRIYTRSSTGLINEGLWVLLWFTLWAVVGQLLTCDHWGVRSLFKKNVNAWKLDGFIHVKTFILY